MPTPSRFCVLPVSLALFAGVRDELVLSDCVVEGVAGPAREGRLRVPEDRGGDAPKGDRSIELYVLVLPRQEEAGDGRALFLLQGGPGQAVSELAPFYATLLAPLRDRWDLVFVDQRGTGRSHPLRLEGPPEDLLTDLGALLPRSWVLHSREALGRDSDLDEYTTEAAVLDLEDVRTALGYASIDLYGTSYGTRVALAYLSRFEERVRSIGLKAVAPPQLIVGESYRRDAQAALDRLFDDCEADQRCHQAFPELRARFWALLSRLESEPARLRVQNPLTGEEEEIELTRAAAAAVVRSLLYAPSAASQLPLFIAQAEAGDFSSWGALAVRVRMGYARGLYAGMSLSVLAAEDAPRAQQRVEEARGPPSFLGDSWFDSMREVAALWPRGSVDPALHRAFPSDVPALLLSGGNDPALPPRWGELAAQTLSRGRHIVIPAAGHSFDLIEGCVDRLLVDFYRAADAGALDDACVHSIRRPPFVLPSVQSAR